MIPRSRASAERPGSLAHVPMTHTMAAIPASGPSVRARATYAMIGAQKIVMLLANETTKRLK